MTSILRKMKRKKDQVVKKRFRKVVKSLAKNVNCTECARPPREKEKIDDWRINMFLDRVELVCTECCTTILGEEIEEE